MKALRLLSVLGCILLSLILTSAVLAGAQHSSAQQNALTQAAACCQLKSISHPPEKTEAPQPPAAPENYGGPDKFGYTFIDSREATGPIYVWEEIAGTGALVTGWTAYSHGYAGPLPVGFPFPFYENLYSDFYISTNGYLSFGQGQTEVPYMVPSTYPPNNIVVPLMLELELNNYGVGTRIYMQHLSNPSRLVVEFVDIHSPHYFADLTFEVILYANGDIQFQYQSIAGLITNAGIENETGTDGRPCDYSMADQIAILFRYPTKNIEFTPKKQTGFASASQPVTYTVALRSYLTDTQQLQLAIQPGNLWTTSLSVASTPALSYGEDYSFTVEVDIPPSALPSDIDFAVIRATSTISPGIYSTTTLKTGVPSGLNAYLPVSAINGSPYLTVWDTQLDVLVDSIDLDPSGCGTPTRAAIPPQSGMVWLTCLEAGKIVVVDTSTNQIIETISGFSQPTQIAFTQDGRYALVGSFTLSGEVTVVDTVQLTITKQIPFAAFVHPEGIVMHPYLPRAYVVSSYDNSQVFVIDTNAMTVTGSFDGWYRAGYEAISRDGLRLYTSHTYRDTVSAIDLLEQKLIENVSGFRQSSDLAVTHDGRKLYVSDRYEPILTAVDTSNMQVLHTFQLPVTGLGSDMDITCDGSKLYFLGVNSGASSDQLLISIDTVSDTVLDYFFPPDLDGDGNPDGHFTDVAACPQYVDQGAAFWPPSQAASADRGQTITYQQALVNAAGITDTFSLVLGPHAWQSSLSDAVLGPLGPNEMISFTVQVSVPLDADWYANETLAVIASGMGSRMTGTLLLTTTAYAPPQVSADPQAFTATLFAHDSTTRSLSLANGAGVTLTYALESADGSGSPYTELLPAGYYYTTTSDNENNYGDGTPDGDMDGYLCYGDYDAPLEFNIWITGSVAGVSESLGLYVFDNQLGEQNQVYLNGVNLGVLERAEAVWHETVFELPPGLAHTGKNLVQVYPDHHATYYSCVWLDWGRIFVQAPPVDWISTLPTSGSIPTDGSQAVAITLDAAALQPGGYTAFLQVHSSDPLQSWLHLPVSLTVLPTAQMGWVEGTVLEAQSGQPLESALRAIGQPYVVHTDPQTGAYQFWLDQGSYQLEASASGYLTQTAQVTITAGMGIYQDFSLVPYLPVIAVSPPAISQSVPLGSSFTRVMTISNLGPQPLSFEIDQYPPNFNWPPRILAWTAYIGSGTHYQHVLAALNDNTAYSLQETTTENPAVLASLLSQADVFLIPDQPIRTYYYLRNLGIAWSDVLQQFVSNGGVIIALGARDRAAGIPNGAGLTSINWVDYYTSSELVDVRDPNHPLSAGLPPLFIGEANLGLFTWNAGHAIATIQYYPPEDFTVGTAQYGLGCIVQMAFDFQNYNADMARLLANAVNWMPTLDTSWLSVAPQSGTVPGYASLPVQINLSATGVQPGVFSAALGVHSSDPQSPVVVVPVTMTVPTSPDLGQVAGTVSDLWSGAPLSGTVGLGGLYTTTASPDFDIWAPAGAYSLTAAAAGHLTQTLSVSVLPGMVTRQDILLEPLQPRLEGLPVSIEMTLTQGAAGTYAVDLLNTGPVNLNFSILEITASLGLAAEAPQDLSGVRILFDYFHSHELYPQETFLWEQLVEAGAQVDANLDGPLDAGLLSGYDILRVGYTDNSYPWSQDELDAIAAWVAQGHGLFIDGASPWFSGADLPDFFGFDAIFSCMTCGEETTTYIQPHPVTQGISNFLIYIDMFKIYLSHGAQAMDIIYDLDMNPQVAVASLGSGKIIAMGNQNLVDNARHNPNNITFSMNLFMWLSLPGGEDIPWLSTEPVSGTIPGHSSLPLAVGFDASALSPGEYHASLLFQTDDLSHSSTFLPVTLTVEAAQAGVSLTPASQAGGAAPGSSAVYTFTIANLGDIADAFDLSVESTWNAILSTPATTLLDPGETHTFTLTVQVPTGAAQGEQDTALVTAASQFDPQVSTSAQAVTTAQLPAGGVSLAPASQSGSAAPGETAVYTLTVTNLGAAPDNFNLQASGVWTATLSTLTTGLLDPGESLSFTLSVQVPVGAAQAGQDVTLVGAVSLSNPSVSDSVLVTTTVRMPRLLLPLLLR